jgi:hypothetical protein
MTLPYLEQLREFSMGQTTETAGEMRFHLLETLREYGEEHLAGEERCALGRRHAEFFPPLAAVAVAQAQSELAACLFGTAEGLHEVIGAPLPSADRAEHDRSVAAVRTALGEAGKAKRGAGPRVCGGVGGVAGHVAGRSGNLRAAGVTGG